MLGVTHRPPSARQQNCFFHGNTQHPGFPGSPGQTKQLKLQINTEKGNFWGHRTFGRLPMLKKKVMAGGRQKVETSSLFRVRLKSTGLLGSLRPAATSVSRARCTPGIACCLQPYCAVHFAANCCETCCHSVEIHTGQRAGCPFFLSSSGSPVFPQFS